jgi:flagellar hook-basal body complex protein FliE
MMPKVIAITGRQQKTLQKESEEDRSFEQLLKNAFRALDSQQQRARIETSVSNRNEKVQSLAARVHTVRAVSRVVSL